MSSQGQAISNLELSYHLLTEKIPEYMDNKYLQYSLVNDKVISLPFLDINASKEEYLQYFNNCWLLTEILFHSLKYEQSFYKKPYHLLRHPLIFYYGHVASLYINKMLVAGLISKPINQEFETIFETGVDEMTWDIDTKQNHINWPSLAAVKSYRKKVYELVTKVINENNNLFTQARSQQSPLWAILMSFEHERIHLETSSVLIRELAIEYVRYPKLFSKNNYVTRQNNLPKVNIDYPQNKFIKISQNTANIGKNDPSTYGWDNEYGNKNIEVSEFSVTKALISNGEFFEFVKDNGYHEDKYWSENGLKWRKFRNIYHPTFWLPNGPKGSNLFKLRTCFEVIDMQWNYPVIVNHFEAKAFCTYKQYKEKENFRLIHEAEHKLLANYAIDPVKNKEIESFNFNLQHLSENPVNINKQENDIYDANGNLWQWLEDNFYPLDDFVIHDYYKDFSTPCFDDKHKMIAGSSFFSTGNLASIYSRYHFREHFFQHAGFRIVKDKKEFTHNIKIEFKTINPKDAQEYIVFRNNNDLQILSAKEFIAKYGAIN